MSFSEPVFATASDCNSERLRAAPDKAEEHEMIHQHVASSVPMAGMLSIVGGCGSDSEGTGFGVGASCAFCMNSAWEFKSANLP